jgi:hypothetical protein
LFGVLEEIVLSKEAESGRAVPFLEEGPVFKIPLFWSSEITLVTNKFAV